MTNVRGGMFGAGVALGALACQRAPAGAPPAVTSATPPSPEVVATTSASVSASAGVAKLPPRGDGCWGTALPEETEARLDLVAKRCATSLTLAGKAQIAAAPSASAAIGDAPANGCVRVIAVASAPARLVVESGGQPIADDRGSSLLIAPADGVSCVRAAGPIVVRAFGLAGPATVEARAYVRKP